MRSIAFLILKNTNAILKFIKNKSALLVAFL